MQLSGIFSAKPTLGNSTRSNKGHCRTTVPGRRAVSVRAANEPVLKDASAVEQRDIIFNPDKEGSQDLQKVEQTKLAGGESLARVFYAPESEQAVNEQINHEYTMSYVYHQMSSYFARDSVALPGLSKFFLDHSFEEREHAQQLMDFQRTRGGRVKLATITAPETEYNHPEKGDALHAMELSLALERLNLQYLYKLHESQLDDQSKTEHLDSCTTSKLSIA